MTQEIIDFILNDLEKIEYELISWGDTGGYFTEDEIINVIKRYTDENECYDYLNQMLENVLFELN